MSPSRPSSRLFHPGRWAAALAAALLLHAGPASAWSISVGTGFLSDAFYLSGWTGPPSAEPGWTTVQEGVRAIDGTGPTFPIVWDFQSWDGSAWPMDSLDASDSVTFAAISHGDVSEEDWDSAEAAVFGAVAAGTAVGAGFAYDFEFVLNPFQTATVLLEDGFSFLEIESDVGDIGFGFAALKLYSTDVDINDPGGANMPYASFSSSHTAGDPMTFLSPTFSFDFVNSTASPLTFNLRLEGTASVFAVPEPGTAALLGFGGVLLGVWRQRSG